MKPILFNTEMVRAILARRKTVTRRVVKPPPKPPRRKKVPVKCSTCADWTCRQRGSVCDWKHCGKWIPGERKNG